MNLRTKTAEDMARDLVARIDSLTIEALAANGIELQIDIESLRGRLSRRTDTPTIGRMVDLFWLDGRLILEVWTDLPLLGELFSYQVNQRHFIYTYSPCLQSTGPN